MIFMANVLFYGLWRGYELMSDTGKKAQLTLGVASIRNLLIESRVMIDRNESDINASKFVEVKQSSHGQVRLRELDSCEDRS